MADGSELGDVYGATIGRIKAQDGDKSRLGMAALMWISHSERPLRAEELCHALAVRLGSIDFNTDNVPSIATLVSCCQGLITVDKAVSTVRLIHFTLQEYLSSHLDIFNRPHSAMAEICLTYLNSQQVKALPTALSTDTQSTPFLGYCSVYWGVHAKRELSDCARLLALELLKSDYNQISTKFLLVQVKPFKWFMKQLTTLSPFSGLHCASFFGIAEVVAGLIEMGCYDINGQDFAGYTPLTWAARNGHEEVVKLLLGREEVDPDKPDFEGQSPLSLAAWDGRERVVEILLGREEVDPDKPCAHGMTPLFFAIWFGHDGVVKILLGREEVDPNKPNNDGRTPLSYAAQDGHVGIVEILLGREDVKPDKPDNYGRTPLFSAAGGGYEAVVKILLGRVEVNPNRLDNYGRTPLSLAAEFGEEAVVEILLRQEEVNPDQSNDKGQTALSAAIKGGHKEVVALLLAHQAITSGTV